MNNGCIFFPSLQEVNISNITANTLPQKKRRIMRFITLFKIPSCTSLVQQSSGTAVFKHCVLNPLRHTVFANSSDTYYSLPTEVLLSLSLPVTEITKASLSLCCL